MKEFGTRGCTYFYVVYPHGECDPHYEDEKMELMRKWDGLSRDDVFQIIEKCKESVVPYPGIPHDENNEVLAIVVNTANGLGASFLRIMPKHDRRRTA